MLARNYSYVLHEPSWSPAVEKLAQEGHRLASATRNETRDLLEQQALAAMQPQIVLTAHIGLPQLLQSACERLSRPPAIVAIDRAGMAATRECTFFRAPARLALPAGETERLAVAAVITRPGGITFELVHAGPFHWPDDQPDAIAALEKLIRAHVAQWRPARDLWGAPAEELLPEVLSRTT